MRNASRSLDGFTRAALSASRYPRCWPVTTMAAPSLSGCDGPGALCEVGSPTVAITSSATEQLVSRAAQEPTRSEVADHPKKVARPVGRRSACCTLPRYRLRLGEPGGRDRGYLMVVTSSPDIAPSCPDQVPQSCCGPSGKSKCPLWPPTER